MKNVYTLIGVACLTLAGCNHVSPVAPTVVPVPPSQVTYAINIPEVLLAHSLAAQWPNGIRLSPLDAQRQYDYTATYKGSPNVYYGETAPMVCTYENAGIVVAPRTIAGMSQFTALDWPGIGLDPGITYEWLGRFAYAEPAPIGSYVPGICPAVPIKK